MYFLAYSRLSIFIGKINFFNALVYFLFEPGEVWLLSGVIFLISSHGSKMCTWSVARTVYAGWPWDTWEFVPFKRLHPFH